MRNKKNVTIKVNIELGDDELASTITAWFNQNKNKKNIWNDSSTGKAIKEIIQSRGYFKLNKTKHIGDKIIKAPASNTVIPKDKNKDDKSLW